MAAPVIETPRLLLRPWRESDFDGWVTMCIDPRVTEFFAVTYDRERADTLGRALAERLDRNGYGWWAVEVKGGAPFIGIIELQEVPFDAPFTPALEVGWWFSPGAWGHGYATEGARAAIAFAFAQLGRNEVVAIVSALNVRSRRVAERLGMTHDPSDDFMHPRVPEDQPVRECVLYRIGT